MREKLFSMLNLIPLSWQQQNVMSRCIDHMVARAATV